ncbi:hypothetical protein BHE74_00053009 [Ensete ventricosum]|nr:hypothetical protein BHE74_00053009 [Ensete ventricosum]
MPCDRPSLHHRLYRILGASPGIAIAHHSIVGPVVTFTLPSRSQPLSSPHLPTSNPRQHTTLATTAFLSSSTIAASSRNTLPPLLSPLQQSLPADLHRCLPLLPHLLLATACYCSRFQSTFFTAACHYSICLPVTTHHRFTSPLPSPSVASSSYPKEDYHRPPLFLLSSSVVGQPSTAPLPLPPLPPIDHRYPSPACCCSRLCHLSSSRFFPVIASLLLLPLHPLRPLLSRAFLPLHLHHRRCPTSSLQLQPSPATIAAPLQSPPLLAASSLLSALTAATHRCLLPCRCCPRCRYRFQSRPCRCTSLLPSLELFVATATPTISNQLFDILVILTPTISL